MREIRAVLVVSSPCWVKASADGHQVLARTLQAGGRVSLHARRTLDLVLGNPAGARLVANGKPVLVPTRGGVARLTLTLRAGRLVVR